MTRKYTFTAKDLEIIIETRQKNKDKRAEVRLHALQLRAEGKRSKEIAEVVGVSAPYISQLAARYFTGGIEGSRLFPLFRKKALELLLLPLYSYFSDCRRNDFRQLLQVSEIKQAYQEKVDHEISSGQIYYVLHRHGWRKIMPRSRHPKKAKPEAIEVSKK